MDDTVLTIALEGTVSLADFVAGMSKFRTFVAALSSEIGGRTPIEWQVDELQASSAIATVRGHATDPRLVLGVVQAAVIAGDATRRGDPVPYSAKVRTAVQALAKLPQTCKSITSVRIETATDDVVFASLHADRTTSDLTYAYGQVRGTVQTLTNRRSLRFLLYDAIFDRPVACYLNADQEVLMRDVWGYPAVVSGLIGRDPVHHRPIVVRHIRTVTRHIDSAPTAYQTARGSVLPDERAAEPEVILRELRDAW